MAQNMNVNQDVNRSAVLDTFMYLDYKVKEDGLSISQVLDKVSRDDNFTSPTGEYHEEYNVIKSAIETDPNLGDMVVSDQSYNLGYDSGTNACTFTDPSDGKIYVAYRGTGDGEWMDNGKGMSISSTTQQQRASEYFDNVAEKHGWTSEDNIIITGHSKGGNKAQYVTLNSEHGNCIDKCYSFDGQGFSPKAIDDMKSKYGEAGYNDRLNKMYSICGQDDYVNVLGNKVISEDHTTYINTPVDPKNFAGYHDITYMFANVDGKGNTTFDGSLNNTEDSQGPLGKYAKDLSEKVMKLPEDQRNDCAMAMMQVMELTGGQPNGLNGEKLTAENVIGFAAHGVPAIVSTLITTEDGRKVLKQYQDVLLQSIYDKHGAWAVAGTVAGATFIAPYVIEGAIGTTVIADALDTIIDLGKAAVRIASEIGDFVNSCIDYASDRIKDFENWAVSLFDRIGGGHRYADFTFNYRVANAEIELMKKYKAELISIRERIRSVNSELSFEVTSRKMIGMELTYLEETIQRLSENMDFMKEVLAYAKQTYEKTEDKIIDKGYLTI
ncbi:Mbeg1-like protein [Anaeromicropila herbilytica]|uniref:DUF2974 domain-containing protein n=1 Tax=Anaeromicropila herbilytica TaxID=2785025 RepID=A0A7R7IDV4_9FIRM|nr:Mbeg1-like protein [Anaeromicropila herbilytica]BCN30413.1 hypothetical protein bsdtb5_17080 [Anaeromicropila herbilytica]